MRKSPSIRGTASFIAAPVLLIGAPLAIALPASAAPASATPGARACATSLPTLKATYAAKVPATTNQLIVVRGKAKRSSYNKVEYWARSAGCWSLVRAVKGRNGYAGWSKKPTDGSGLSPIGAYTLTDAGGRLQNPGTTLPYHYGPQSYAGFGYRMNRKPVQVFDYVVAINFNRYIGTPPRDERRPNPKIRDGGIWFHVNGAGATRGCVSVSRPKAAWTLRWLTPSEKPMIIMGPASMLKA